MSDVEDDILYNGFSSDTETDKGTFKDEGYATQFRWETMIERIELPTDMTQKTQDAATKASQDAKNPMAMMIGVPGRHDERASSSRSGSACRSRSAR